ncbi:GNAT family N-acetyltransferase [Listeria costaricensis]|uniref:GNAT family N-acetyltransferase n=1 Tax=Listeria costaricensis TaxID=2026604 RepID=UPI000C081F5F|nr:GNAT family N-acetyltransferase [Listeria costaricensis]
MLTTERLLLRPFVYQDKKSFARLNQNPETMRYFPKPLTEVESNLFLSSIIEEYQILPIGLLAVIHQESGHFIGFIGLHQASFESTFTPCIEIAWRFDAPYWHQGYATEAGAAIIEFARESTEIQEVFSFTARINEPSIRLMKRLNMQFQQVFDHPKISSDSPLCQHVLYKINTSSSKKSP